eukprot:CFRG1272T1
MTNFCINVVGSSCRYKVPCRNGSNTVSDICAFQQNQQVYNMLSSTAGTKELTRAVTGGDSKKVNRILKLEKKGIIKGERTKAKGVNIEARDVDGKTLLMKAVLSTNLECVQALIYCSAIVNSREKDGNTPLHLACECTSDGVIVQELIDADADVDSRNRAGETPLHKAAHYGNESALLKLLQAGANSGLFSVNGMTCLDMAASNRQAKACAVLIDSSPKMLRSIRSLFEAIQCKDLSVARVLLEAGMPPTVTYADDESGETPLHIAVRTNQPEMVRLLLEHGASTEKVNTNMQAPQDLSAPFPTIVEIFQNIHKIKTFQPTITHGTKILKEKEGADWPLLQSKIEWCSMDADMVSDASGTNNVWALVDGNDKTHFEMIMHHDRTNFVIFDFGREYMLSGIRLCGNSSPHMIKEFTLETSNKKEGPWTIGRVFTAEQKGVETHTLGRGDNQDFKGLKIRTRFLRMVVNSNHGAYSTCWNGIGFFGIDHKLTELLRQFQLMHMFDDFVNMSFVQVQDLWMVTDVDVKRLCKGNTQDVAKLQDALHYAREEENKLTAIDFGIAPVRFHPEGKRLPEFTILGDSGCQDEIALAFQGDPDVTGLTVKRLVPDPKTGRSKASFTGISLSPVGNYVIEAYSVTCPDIFVHTAEPTTIGFFMKDKEHINDTFSELDDILNI